MYCVSSKENRKKPQITHIFVGVLNKIYCRREQKLLWKNYDINLNSVIAKTYANYINFEKI